jgi:predicted ribosome quality control (RQC) complex YloA/Tae2 family protein
MYGLRIQATDDGYSMYFDALTLAAVADELRETILGGRIQRVVLTGPLSIGLEIYARGRRRQLIASAHPQLARVHLVEARLSRGVEQDTPLLLLMRKYLLGGRVVAVEQPALERVVLLSIVKPLHMRNRAADGAVAAGHDDTGTRGHGDDEDQDLADEGWDEEDLDPEGEDEPFDARPSSPNPPLPSSPNPPLPQSPTELLRCELAIEPQDRRSNIILVDDNNLILDSVKRVTPRMSSRVVMPRQVYELPPPPEKRDPALATAAGIEALAQAGERDLARALVSAYRGVSPQVAREVVFRALGRTRAAVDEPLPHYTLAARLRELFTAPAEPALAPGAPGPAAFAPYALTHLPGSAPAASMSAALEAFYRAREALTGHSQRRDALAQQLAAARERLVRQREQISGELDKARDLELLRWEGEMIFAFLHELRRGQDALEVEGRRIALDPRRPAVEQAQERFKQYDKAKSALAGLPERLAAVEARLAGLDDLAAMLQISDDFAQIEQLAREAEELGYLREHPDPLTARRRQKAPAARPLHVVSADGFDIFIGRSARQNEEVTFRIGRAEDLWVHVRTIHGSHVIVRGGGREIPEAALEQAAGLAAYFSQARDEAAVEVDVCRRALVRRVPGGPPGLVTYRAERTLRVAPRKP